MATSAAASPFEIFLSGFRVSGLQVLRVHSFTSAFSPAAVLSHGVLLRVDEGDQAGDLLVGAIERRHAFLRAAVANHRTDLVAIDVGGHQLGSRQVGPALSSGCVAAVAEGAVLPEQSRALLDKACGITLALAGTASFGVG